MSKFLNMGWPLPEDVIAPIHMAPRARNQTPGAGEPFGGRGGRRRGAADRARRFRLRGREWRANARRAEVSDCELTVRDGKVVYDLNGITREDWDKLGPRYTAQGDLKWDAHDRPRGTGAEVAYGYLLCREPGSSYTGEGSGHQDRRYPGGFQPGVSPAPRYGRLAASCRESPGGRGRRNVGADAVSIRAHAAEATLERASTVCGRRRAAPTKAWMAMLAGISASPLSRLAVYRDLRRLPTYSARVCAQCDGARGRGFGRAPDRFA